MKNTHITRDINEALNVFSHELPDACITNRSTVTDLFDIGGQQTCITAQKEKGICGMRWRFEYNTAEQFSGLKPEMTWEFMHACI